MALCYFVLRVSWTVDCFVFVFISGSFLAVPEYPWHKEYFSLCNKEGSLHCLGSDSVLCWPCIHGFWDGPLTEFLSLLLVGVKFWLVFWIFFGKENIVCPFFPVTQCNSFTNAIVWVTVNFLQIHPCAADFFGSTCPPEVVDIASLGMGFFPIPTPRRRGNLLLPVSKK